MTKRSATQVIPVIQLGSRLTYPFPELTLPMIAVRMQDLLTSTGKRFNSVYSKIKEAGGLRKFLNYEGDVFLSLIMTDKQIANCNPSKYAEAIDIVSPTCVSTVDGETYDGEKWLSLFEIHRMLDETEELMELRPKYKYVGLVKGCTPDQILYHTIKLSELGIDSFLFHAVDYLDKKRKSWKKDRAIRYAAVIKRKANRLFIYGGEKVSELSFADGFLIVSHWQGMRKEKSHDNSQPERRKRVISNLIATIGKIKRLNNIGRLV